MATPPPPPAPGSPYGQPNPYQPTPPGPYDQPNPYGQPSPNPYADQIPAQGNPYGQQAAAPYAAPPQQPGYGYPQQQPVPQQMGYGYPQQQPMAPADWAVPAPNGVTCRFCGGYPAVNTTVRAHRGLIILMYFRRLPGPFCKTCGTAAIRDMSGQTLVQGWWGYGSSIITPITLIINLFAYNKIRSLPAPAPNPPGPPMNPGKPLLRRPHALGFLLPVMVLLLIIVAASTSSSSGDNSNDPYAPPASSSADTAVAGDCLHNNGTSSSPDLSVVPCTTGTILVLQKLTGTTSDAGCPSGTTDTFTSTGGSEAIVLCTKPYAG